jgi:hypothetical protein
MYTEFNLVVPVEDITCKEKAKLCMPSTFMHEPREREREGESIASIHS